MKSLAIGKILPSSENQDPTYSFHYKGSHTSPPCDENVYWFVYEDILDINPKTLEHIKNNYLKEDKEHFNDMQNARELQKTRDFKMVNLTFDALKGL